MRQPASRQVTCAVKRIAYTFHPAEVSAASSSVALNKTVVGTRRINVTGFLSRKKYLRETDLLPNTVHDRFLASMWICRPTQHCQRSQCVRPVCEALSGITAVDMIA